ncbi:MAG: hypothetical protein OXC63_14790 [Aestuariivita sp.]|nr:hypothetical protein [Aestuariivita sp.]MCY4347882.1 hypothetical protein [Aestuariivita sp.]
MRSDHQTKDEEQDQRLQRACDGIIDLCAGVRGTVRKMEGTSGAAASGRSPFGACSPNAEWCQPATL